MIRASLFVTALFVAACTPPAEEPPVADPAVAEAPAADAADDLCGASQYQQLVGTNVAAVTVPEGTRVIGPDTIVTQDLRADRLNFRTDADGVITSVECF